MMSLIMYSILVHIKNTDRLVRFNNQKTALLNLGEEGTLPLQGFLGKKGCIEFEGPMA